MKTDNQYSELLFKYFSGKLSDEERQELLAWLKESDEHMSLLNRMSDWWAVAHIPLYKSDLEADFVNYFDYLEGLSASSKSKRRITIPSRWLQVAVVVLALITLVTSAFYLGKYTVENKELLYTETIVPNGSQTKIMLPDSTFVMLNSGSSLRYSSDFNKKDRCIELKGEAYFDVKPNTDKPFFVNSDKINVRVVGTTFNVRAYEDEDKIDVVLISGKVNVLFENDILETTSLVPNQQLSYNKKEEKLDVTVVNGATSILWTKGVLYFNEKTFADIAKELRRKFDTEIIIESDMLYNEVFTGSFSVDYTLEKIVKEIDVDNKYYATYNDGKLIIKDKYEIK